MPPRHLFGGRGGGPERDADLAEKAGGRADLLVEAAGVLLGGRPNDETDPRYVQCTYGAELLLELA